MDYIELYALVVIYSQSTAVVATAPTLATCQAQQAELVRQVAPLKPGVACVKDRRYYIADFKFKELP